MNLREYVVTVILVLAILIGGYHYLGRLLTATIETTAQSINHER